MEKTLTLYAGVNESVLAFVPLLATRILDVGCGTGVLGERLCRERERTVVGITYSAEEASSAAHRLSRVICADLNTFDFCELGNFDCIILSHILEHLYSPEDMLEKLKGHLEPHGVIIVALPNVLWWKQRLQFLFGRWRYQDWGILDRTHFRFFDLYSSRDLLQQAGYEVLRTRRDGPFPFTGPIRRFVGPLATRMDRMVCALVPGLFAFQVIYLARVKR